MSSKINILYGFIPISIHCIHGINAICYLPVKFIKQIINNDLDPLPLQSMHISTKSMQHVPHSTQALITALTVEASPLPC